MPIILRSKGIRIELYILTVGTLIGTIYYVLYNKNLVSATLLSSPLLSQDTDTSHTSRKSLKSRDVNAIFYLSEVL